MAVRLSCCCGVSMTPSQRGREEGGGGGCRKGNGLFAASEPRRDQEEGGGLRKLDCVLLQLFPNSCATDIVFVTPLRTAVETEIGGVH